MSQPAIAAFLTADHRSCDALLATVEAHVQAREWSAAAAAWLQFERTLRCHFAREEEILFPAFEAATGHRGGPTVVMRMEHEQMRALFGPLATAVRDRDERRSLGLSDSLLLLIQQHNMKEENMLYPMCDQAVPAAGALCERLAALQPDQG